MENKQKALEMVATMQQKEESGSLLWCVAEDLKNTINGMNEDEARVVVTDFEAGSMIENLREKRSTTMPTSTKAAVLPAAPARPCRVSCACILACRRAARAPHPPRRSVPNANA